MLYPVERWLSGPLWVRCVSIAVLACAGVVLINGLSLQPLRNQIQEYSTKNQHERERIAKLRRDVISLMLSTKGEDSRFSDVPAPRFSIMEWVQESGGKLERWQPENKPANLEILLNWENLPAIFVRFSSYSGVALQSFSMEPQGEKLKLSMALEIADES